MSSSPEIRIPEMKGIQLFPPGSQIQFNNLGTSFTGPEISSDLGLAHLSGSRDSEPSGIWAYAIEDGQIVRGRANEFDDQGYHQLTISIDGHSGEQFNRNKFTYTLEIERPDGQVQSLVSRARFVTDRHEDNPMQRHLSMDSGGWRNPMGRGRLYPLYVKADPDILAQIRVRYHGIPLKTPNTRP